MRTVKEFLEDIRESVSIMDTYQQELLRIRIIAYGAPTAGYGVITGHTEKKDSPQEHYVIEMEKCENKIKNITTRYAKNTQIAIDMIEKLSKTKYKSALLLYYMNNMSEKACALKIGISLRQFQYRKQQALIEIEPIYNDYRFQIA